MGVRAPPPFAGLFLNSFSFKWAVTCQLPRFVGLQAARMCVWLGPGAQWARFSNPLPSTHTAPGGAGLATHRASSSKLMNTRLYVGNLSFNTTADGVRTAFMEFGNVSDVHLVTDRETGRSRGFAFVTMGTAEEAAKAIQGMDGRTLDGRPLRVNEAEQRQARGGGGGGGGGGFRGGGGGGGRGGYGGGGRGGYGGGGGDYGGGGGGGDWGGGGGDDGGGGRGRGRGGRGGDRW